MLYDENGEKRDKVPTKAANGQSKNYVIRAIEFSSDSTRLAVAQSDNIIYVFKVGADWGERKSIVNKLAVSSSVTTMVWPREKIDELYFGLAEGKPKFFTPITNHQGKSKEPP